MNKKLDSEFYNFSMGFDLDFPMEDWNEENGEEEEEKKSEKKKFKTHDKMNPPVGKESCTIVGISGGTASGKSSIARMLECNDVISQDNYYKALSDKERKKGEFINWDTPNRLNYEKYLRDLQDLKRGLSIQVPVYDRINERPIRNRKVYPNGVIVVEGIFVGYTPEERELLDVYVYVDVDADTRLIRRLRRDSVERGKSMQRILEEWESFIKPGHERFVEPNKKFADIIIPRGAENQSAIEMIKKHTINNKRR